MGLSFLLESEGSGARIRPSARRGRFFPGLYPGHFLDSIAMMSVLTFSILKPATSFRYDPFRGWG